MFERLEWRDGWLCRQSVPNGEWHRLTEREIIDHLVEENQRLKDRLGAIREIMAD